MKRTKALWIGMGLAFVLCGCGSLPQQGTQEAVTSADNAEASDSAAADNEAASEENGGSTESVRPGEEALAGLLETWNFDKGDIWLEQVTEALDSEGIRYTGYYNVSGERLDMTLEDGTSLVFFEISDPEAEDWERSERYQLMMKGEEFNQNRFQENYLNEYDVTVDDYIWPDLSDPGLESEMLYRCNQTDLMIARNQLFAKYGREFADPFLNALFLQKNWYEPSMQGSSFDEKVQELLTDTEKTNLEAVLAREEEYGYRKGGSYETARALLSGSWLDVDGDGEREQILYRAEEDPDNVGMAELTIREESGQTGTVSMEAYAPHKSVYTCIAEEGTIYLAIADNGMSADFVMEFWVYEDGRLISLGNIDTYPGSIQLVDGKISGMVETMHLQCEPIRFTYERSGEALEWQRENYYEYRGNEAEALTGLELYTAKGDVQPSRLLNAGDKVKVLGGDLADWVKLERLSDGLVCWIRVKDGECRLPDGSMLNSSLVFEGLTFYG